MKLSTRKNLTAALAVALALMMLWVFLQKQLGIGTGYSVLPLGDPERDESLYAPLSENDNPMADLPVYMEVNDRALFTTDRTAPPEQPPPQVVDPGLAKPAAPLTAQLTGIVITQRTKVALLRAASGDQSFRLREGQPFPGDLAGWRVKEISPRSVTFDGGSLGLSELKLDVSKGGPSSPMPTPVSAVPLVSGSPPVMPQTPAAAVAIPNPNIPVQSSADQAAREAEVQKIIEERRAQMRAEAERMSAEKQ